MPWGAEALEHARVHDLPILVSIGYAACHWCHVMERECFEDAETAALMNEHFVCVKVDREERPDVDALYMEAVQVMTGQGGWPLNVFLTPAQVPFYGGTYFPPAAAPRHAVVAPGAARRRGGAGASAAPRSSPTPGAAVERLAGGARLRPSADPLGARRARRRRSARSRASFDSVQGGWGRAAAGRSSPAASVIEFLLARGEPRDGAADAALRWPPAASTTRSAAASPATASTARWTVPHFEKMLYDNALLARAYLHGWLVSGDPVLRRTCEETLDWALREMRGPGRRLLQLARRGLRGRGGHASTSGRPTS